MSIEDAKNMKNVVEDVIKNSGLSKSQFAERSAMSRSTLYSHLKSQVGIERAAQLFWLLSKRIQDENPEVFEEVVLGKSFDTPAEVELLRLTQKAQAEIEKIIGVLNDDASLMCEIDDPEDITEYEDAQRHLSALKRIFKLREISIKERIQKIDHQTNEKKIDKNIAKKKKTLKGKRTKKPR
jgi:hypothetical protein